MRACVCQVKERETDKQNKTGQARESRSACFGPVALALTFLCILQNCPWLKTCKFPAVTSDLNSELFAHLWRSHLFPTWPRLQARGCLCSRWCPSPHAIYLIHLFTATGKLFSLHLFKLINENSNSLGLYFPPNAWSAEAFFFAGCTTVIILILSVRFIIKKTPVDPLFYGMSRLFF